MSAISILDQHKSLFPCVLFAISISLTSLFTTVSSEADRLSNAPIARQHPSASSESIWRHRLHTLNMATGPVTTVDHATTEKLLGNGTPPAQASSSAQNPAAGTSVRSDPSFVPHPMFHRPTMHSVDIEDYFRGPRDVHRHSKWPVSMRLHGSILPKMIVPLSLVAAWATLIVCISQLVQTLEVNSVLLTVTGFVVSLSLSFRSTTAYERFTEGRKYWSQLLLNSRNLARLIWVHVEE